MKSRTQEVKQAMVSRFKERRLCEFTPDGLMPVIDSMFPLSEAPDAHRRMEANLNAKKIDLLPPPDEV
jgi:NADPH2:quinone reductase